MFVTLAETNQLTNGYQLIQSYPNLDIESSFERLIQRLFDVKGVQEINGANPVTKTPLFVNQLGQDLEITLVNEFVHFVVVMATSETNRQ